MDANLLKKGEDFDKLPETWVIFITENDVMGKGLPLYPIERCFLGTGERFEDGSHILYVNGAYRGDTPIGKLMHDFSCTDAAHIPNVEQVSTQTPTYIFLMMIVLRQQLPTHPYNQIFAA